MKQFGFVPVLIVVLIAVTALGGYFVYQKFQTTNIPSQNTPKDDQVACSQDAKLCPDGSYVGRVEPNCEFTPCPTSESTSSATTANWKTYVNNEYSYSLKYPITWKYKISSKGSGQIMFLPKGKEFPPEPSFIVVTVYDSVKQPLISDDARNSLINKNVIKIAGVDGELGEFTGYIQSAAYYNNKSYYINLHTLEYRNIYDQILSTFKFLE